MSNARAGVAGDAAGALAATFVALPQALSLGVVAFAALGPQYAAAGVMAAVLALVIGNISAAATYSVKNQLVGPRSASTALVAGLAAALAAHPSLQADGLVNGHRVIGLVLACVVLSGVFVTLLGLTGFGRAIKYVPYPVLAGFMNGVAIVIVVSQARAVLGLPGQDSLAATLADLGDVRWGSIATVAVVLAAINVVPRYVRWMPSLLAGLVAGVAAHYLFGALAPAAVGPVIGPLPPLEVVLQAPRDVAGAVAGIARLDPALLNILVAQAALLATVGALDSLLAAVICDGVTRGRHDSSRVLVGVGLANVVGGALGAIPALLNTHTPLASFRAGARTPLATLLHAAFVLALVVVAAPAIGAIPLAVPAGLMLYIAYSLFDRWSGELLRRMRAQHEDRAEISVNILIVVLVAVALAAMNVAAALAIGVAISIALLLVKLSAAPVRRHMDGLARSSHKVRSPEAREALRGVAGSIRILELQGELFFGTADQLQSEVEGLPEGTRFAILDLRRIHQIDASGARVLQVIGQRAAARRIAVLLSEIRADDRHGRYLRAMGVDASIPASNWFADLDRALEFAEDVLLDQQRFGAGTDAEIPLESMALFRGLDEAQLARVGGSLQRLELGDGDPVFLEGEDGDRLFLLARGSVSIKMRLAGHERARRLATFAPGVMFGEMALLERKRRSADAFAKGGGVLLYALSAAALEQITREDPAIALRIHVNLGSELASRLRATSDQLRALE